MQKKRSRTFLAAAFCHLLASCDSNFDSTLSTKTTTNRHWKSKFMNFIHKYISCHVLNKYSVSIRAVPNQMVTKTVLPNTNNCRSSIRHSENKKKYTFSRRQLQHVYIK